MKHTVIIPVYISESSNVIMTQKCIQLAREKTKLPFELIIWETCSDYFTKESDIHVYERARTGTATVWNRSCQLAEGEYVTYLTNDVFVDDGWLECLEDCFKIEDCGLATLGSDEAKNIKEDRYEEAFWFSLCMFKRETLLKYPVSTDYKLGTFEDTDLVMRMRMDNLIMYRNLNCIVQHLKHKTHQANSNHDINFVQNRELFNNRFKDLPMTKHQRDLFELLR